MTSSYKKLIQDDMKALHQTQIRTVRKLPKSLAKNSIVIIDRELLRNAQVRVWSSHFHVISVTAGESLKSLEQFTVVMKKVLKLAEKLPGRDLQIVAVGGGSVGDFSGFLASVFKRGVRLIHIPSTWLSAIDSAHGGKTALNFEKYKNQIGTFYAAEVTYLVQELLESQPSHLADEGFSEILKISLIDSPTFYRELTRTKAANKARLIFRFLERAVQAKLKIVARDPFEKKGLRHQLNLGHTLGHYFESHFGLSHGDAVAQGLFFTTHFSFASGYLTERKHAELIRDFNRLGLIEHSFSSVRESTLHKYLAQDKKMATNGKIRFAFLDRPGKVVVREVPLSKVLGFSRALGLCR